MNKTKLYKLINKSLRIFIVSGAMIYLLYLFFSNTEEISLGYIYKHLIDSPLQFAFVLILMPINWGIEANKWYTLVRKKETLSLNTLIKSVLAGISISLFTPNRVGELGGRLVYLKKENKNWGLYVAMVGSTAQMMLTLIIGLFSFYFLYDYFPSFQFISKIAYLVGISLVSMLLFYFYFSSNRIKALLFYFSKKWISEHVQEIMDLGLSDRMGIIGKSLIRYLVFALQFSLLIRIFDPLIPFLLNLKAIGLVYILTSFIPTGWISDLPVRTSIAFLVIEQLGYNGMAGIWSSLILWCINLLLPGLLGLVTIKDISILKFWVKS